MDVGHLNLWHVITLIHDVNAWKGRGASVYTTPQHNTTHEQ